MTETMTKNVEVPRGIYYALNEWFKQGKSEEALVRHVIAHQDNGFGFQAPYTALDHLSLRLAIQLAAAGRKNYTLLRTAEDLILEKYEASNPSDQALIKWVLGTLEEEVEGIN